MAGADDKPTTPQRPVTDTYHGVEVIDDYRWLERGDDEAVRKWSDHQNAHARRVLDKLPHVDALRRDLKKIMAAENIRFSDLEFRAGKLFAIKRQPPRQQPLLVVMDAPDKPDSARVVLDPNVLDPKGATHIDWYVPSPTGALVAISLSKSGTESGDVHVIDTVTGKEKFEVIPRVNGGTAGGDVAWLADESGFFYTRYPRAGERPEADLDFYQQLYFHKLSAPTGEDRYELGKQLPRIAEIKMQMQLSSGRLLVTVQNGDGGEFAMFLRSAEGAWRQFSKFEDGIVQAAFGPNDDIYVVSRDEAPRGEVLRLPIDSLDVSKANRVIAEGADTIVTDFWDKPTVLPTETQLYVTYQLGGPSEIRVFDLDGKPLNGPRQPDVSAVRDLTPLGGDDVLFEVESYVTPGAYYRFRSDSGKSEKTALAEAAPVSFDDIEVRREFATSKDGTKVPINILAPKGAKLDASNPCLVTGYGGYGICIMPGFRASLRALFDRGFVYAVANLRGGGEYGETWHRQGNLTNKQNVFDDFAAALQHMIDRGYTSPEKLAITGGSNGGLLMGATMTQHPRLMKCVVSHVGIYDMLRVELAPNGSFNIPEFGTVKKRDHFRAMHAYSPFHNVSDTAEYPATMFLTGANDPRVDPMHSRKMTARLQAAVSEQTPILLRTSANSGHGGGTALNERIEQTVDVYAFLLDQLGVAVTAPK
jgi:prolyl oligopeptidase